MPCGTVRGASLTFGVDNDEASLTTQSVGVVHKIDKKEARDKCGIVTAVAYYNPTHEISVEGLGTSIATAVGASITLAGSYGLSGTSFVEEISIDHANEEFRKVSIKITCYPSI